MATTATRLAGMDIPTSSTPVPPPIPTDLESQTTHSVTPRPSRSSLPLDRRPSRKSIHSQRSRASLAAHTAPDRDLPPLPPPGPQYSITTSSLQPAASDPAQDTATQALHSPFPDDDAPDPDPDAEDIPWGPTHPCFPHPNPHVARDSEAYASTRVIRIQRDYLVAGDAYPQFQNVYPEILAEWISEDEFRVVIEEVNTRCKTAFDPEGARAKVDALLGVLTGFVWDDLGVTGVKRGVKGLEAWMEGWNSGREGRGEEGRLVPLRTTGWLNLDVVIPDPGIDVVEEER
ncbi:Golgin subfamily A member 7/ERF4 family-domain-containing protein [Elsinoe ampelina]|uniref:Ras modification protein ERF4 n=1 Tax=Elsinoe ampelina TaxID=302913 RepID=A0A6A6GM82_9PEZI|nr:Golgin subfamily A member 7/ERF4 family-domain-containing protein [Elsinoe ampelina]